MNGSPSQTNKTSSSLGKSKFKHYHQYPEVTISVTKGTIPKNYVED